MRSSPEMLLVLNYTTNPGSLWLSRETPKHHLAGKGCPGFVVEFNTYNISGDDLMSLTSLLH